MFDIPKESHRYFIESLTGQPHLRSTLIKRFLSFAQQIMKSPKIALKNIFNIVKYDTQSVTGYNLRRIMLLVNKNNISDLSPSDANTIEYEPVQLKDKWKVQLVKEITDIKFGEQVLENFPHDDLQKILDFICTT